ncbi:hypothetical protein B0F90DRAFT_1743553 [Multifurca ochricompacta]|uniref:Cytochrome P450 n=1 Tax=Multifurca ochricompacta TaxID=376703 RepID=A0AAD4M226_9AGAM|nr:hypothetical protein B0F90DRAFT_1743553 [Multifurca ochricompacta]
MRHHELLCALQVLTRFPTMGLGFNHGMLPYGGRWSRLRRAFHTHFDAMTSKVY